MSCASDYAPQLRARGFRMTPQRLAILHVLHHEGRISPPLKSINRPSGISEAHRADGLSNTGIPGRNGLGVILLKLAMDISLIRSRAKIIIMSFAGDVAVRWKFNMLCLKIFIANWNQPADIGVLIVM